MNELIEKLKDKNYVRAFGLMTPEEQECFMKVGKKNCLFYSLGGWNIGDNEFFVDITTYAINPDYRPAPEFVDYEITNKDIWIGSKTPDLAWCRLYKIPSLSKFHCFWEKNKCDEGYMLNRSFWTIRLVSPKMSEGKQVYARFRK